jgi:hypothetical protein
MVAAALAALALSGGCTADATKRVINSFVADYNAGRVLYADRLWAPEPRFQWLSTSGPGAATRRDPYNRATLRSFLRARARVHDRIEIETLGAGYNPRQHTVDFGGKLIRSADDLRRGRHDFKGAADCVSGRPKLIVWSM